MQEVDERNEFLVRREIVKEMFITFYVIINFMCMSTPCRGQKMVLDPLELVLQAVVSSSEGVEMEPRAVSVLYQ